MIDAFEMDAFKIDNFENTNCQYSQLITAYIGLKCVLLWITVIAFGLAAIVM